MPHKLELMYTRLYEHFGPQHWWPGDSPLEVMVGAVLTQNTNWQNVSQAIDNLKKYRLLNFAALSRTPVATLAHHIRPAGYYNLKAGRLCNLLSYFNTHHNGDLDQFFAQPTEVCRQELLSVKGVGPETADSILLYAGNHPVFVVDAYTHRILSRHNCIEEEADYSTIQSLFTDVLPSDVAMFNEYHALIVRLGKDYCKKTQPRCSICPLDGI